MTTVNILLVLFRIEKTYCGFIAEKIMYTDEWRHILLDRGYKTYWLYVGVYILIKHSSLLLLRHHEISFLPTLYFFAESLLVYSLSSENAGWSDYDFLFSAMFIHLDGSFYNPLIFWQQNTELQHRSKRCSSSQSERMYCIHELLRSLFFYIDNSVLLSSLGIL